MKRYTKEARAEYLRQYKEYSGSQVSFCQAHGLNVATLQYWLAAERKKSERTSGFINLSPSAIKIEEPPCSYIEIVTSNGTTIRIPA